MLPDYHFHTLFSGDSETPVRAQLDQAVRLGMKSLCVTDHHDYDVDSDIDFTLDISQYFQTMTRLKEEYKKKLDLRIGIELGLQTHLKEYFQELLAANPFDYVIGSTHFINRKDPVYPEFFEGRKEEEAYLQYFQVTLDNLKNLTTYDTAGHMDYIIRYGPGKADNYHYKQYRDVFDEILKAIISNGKGIECNTAGFRKGIHQPNPGKEILTRYRELGGEIITLGSDAHIPEDMGADFDRARDLLLSCGFAYYTEFKQRKPEFKPL
ncbi:histidinol-phosphatase HisJ family protein [Clostridium sp. HBUAS56010]|uniref:histidinol-phosphatase HisJ family protein n=1 Tax=Clostridium sp. HBUAS56010 TaxID=2571127 RepID=UPI0011781C22|nr:histidinol-phosphatase HisJ family protein [Clostridium sp. HBUAS56010]